MKRVSVRFFVSESENEPVRAWLTDLPKEDKKIIGTDIKTVDFGCPIGMPVCKPLGAVLYEVRSHLSSRRIARVSFCLHNDGMILLHGFIKKSQKMPEKDLKISRRRQRMLKNG